MTLTKYSEFKKNFKGDPKLNVTAIDKDENVLAHRAVVFESVLSENALRNVLKKLKIELDDKGGQIEKYEVVYPSVK